MFDYKKLRPATGSKGYYMHDIKANIKVYVVIPSNYKLKVSYCPAEYAKKLNTRQMFHLTIDEAQSRFELL